MPSNRLILCHPLLLPPSIFLSIRVFSNESVLASGDKSIGVSASALDLPMNIQDWFPLGWTGRISLQSKGLSRVFNTTVHYALILGPIREMQGVLWNPDMSKNWESWIRNSSRRSEARDRTAEQAPVWDRVSWYPGRRMRKKPWVEETWAEEVTLAVATVTDFHRFLTGFWVRMDGRPCSASPGQLS